MSMSTHVVGFKPPDEKWKQMKAAYDACKAAGLETPEPIMKFFNYEEPNDNGVRIAEERLPLREWNDDGCRVGFELDVSKLDPDITVIRFYNSW